MKAARGPLLVLLLALLANVWAYAPALDGEFLFDDRALLESFDCWHGIDRVPAMFGFGEPTPCTYRPVRFASFALDYTLFGGTPRSLHISNLVHHLLTMLLVFALFRRLGVGAWTAAVAVCLWSLHPVQTDAVAYISGRRDTLSTLLLVAALLVFWKPAGADRAAENDPTGPTPFGPGLRTGVVRGVLACILFAVAFATKEMAVTFPVLLLICALASPRATWLRLDGAVGRLLRRYWWLILLLVALTIGFVLHRGFTASHSAMQGRWWGGSLSSNFATVGALYLRYFSLLLWPEALIGDYHSATIPLAEGFADPRALAGAGLYLFVLITGVGLAIQTLRATRTSSLASHDPAPSGQGATALVAAGLLWFVVAMLPVSHILPHHELFAEHYLYLPTIGLFLAVASLPQLIFSRLTSRPAGLWVAGLLAVFLASAYAARTHARAYDFRDEQLFYTAAWQHAPENGRVAYHLGVLHVEAGHCESAMPYLRVASGQLDPRNPDGRDTVVAYIVCAARTDTGNVPQAVERLLEANPEDVFALGWQGRLLLEAGELDAAVQQLERVRTLALNSSAARARLELIDVTVYLANAYNRRGRFSDTAALLRDDSVVLRDRRLCEADIFARLNLNRTPPPAQTPPQTRPQTDDGVRFRACANEFPTALTLQEALVRHLLTLGEHQAVGAMLERLARAGAPVAWLAQMQALLSPP